jgi:hypothetical protein
MTSVLFGVLAFYGAFVLSAAPQLRDEVPTFSIVVILSAALALGVDAGYLYEAVT